jgi:predicted nucleotidyltransferase
MAAADAALQKLRELKPRMREQYKVKEIGIFGSFARREQSDQSDLDLLIEFEEGADLFDLVALGQFLEERMGRPVDLVTKRALREEIREQVLKEAAMV